MQKWVLWSFWKAGFQSVSIEELKKTSLKDEESLNSKELRITEHESIIENMKSKEQNKYLKKHKCYQY